MALGASDANAEERDADGFRRILGRTRHAVERCDRLVVRLAAPEKNLARHLVDRTILLQIAAQPAMEIPHRFIAHAGSGNTQQVTPSDGPEVGILGPLQEAVDPARSLVLSWI